MKMNIFICNTIKYLKNNLSNEGKILKYKQCLMLMDWKTEYINIAQNDIHIPIK